MVEYIKVGFFHFAFKYGIIHFPKEVIRIAGRTLQEKAGNIIFLAKAGGGLQGYGVVRLLPKKYQFGCDRGFIIGPYFVENAQRGKGIGSGIVNALISACGSDQHFFAYVGVNNVGSIKAFEKNGFNKVGYMKKIGKRFVIDSQFTDFIVMKR